MKYLMACLILLFSIPLIAQDRTEAVPAAYVVKQDNDDFKGVYFGVTFKKTLEAKNSILQAGYIFKPADKTYLALGIDYDYDLDVSSIQPNVFYEFRPRIYATAGVGADFHNTEFNNSVQLSGGFAYVPDYKLFNTMELAFIANVQYTGWFGFGRSAQLGGRDIVIDNTTDGAEIWLSIVGLGF